MKIGIGNDHHGVQLKQEIMSYLNQLGYDVINFGTNSTENVDYTKYAFQVGEAIKKHQIDYGILICGSGIGMSIACNKVKDVRCAKVDNIKEAELTRLHNDSNVIALNSENNNAKEIVKVFLETPFSNEERHINRINMISKLLQGGNYCFYTIMLCCSFMGFIAILNSKLLIISP